LGWGPDLFATTSPSDTDGIVRIALDDAGEWKLLLARELARELIDSPIGVDWATSVMGRR
jgi:hypothetical protein